MMVARGVRKVYRTGAEEVEALRSIDLTVSAGEFLAVMGPSGSGKTTLLNCLSGLDDIDGGEVILDGVDLHALPDAARTRNRASSMGFVFQAFNLIPVFSAVENVELPLLLAGEDPKEARRRAAETLERVGLGEPSPAQAERALRRRAAARHRRARALAGRPRVVWADEPTGALDSETAATVMDLLQDLHREGLTLDRRHPRRGRRAERGASRDDARRARRGRRAAGGLSAVGMSSALAPILVLSLPFLYILARRPVLRRLALRNARRRPREAMRRDRRIPPRHGDHDGVVRHRRHVHLVDPGLRVRPARPHRRDRGSRRPRRGGRAPGTTRRLRPTPKSTGFSPSRGSRPRARPSGATDAPLRRRR